MGFLQILLSVVVFLGSCHESHALLFTPKQPISAPLPVPKFPISLPAGAGLLPMPPSPGLVGSSGTTGLLGSAVSSSSLMSGSPGMLTALKPLPPIGSLPSLGTVGGLASLGVPGFRQPVAASLVRSTLPKTLSSLKGVMPKPTQSPLVKAMATIKKRKMDAAVKKVMDKQNAINVDIQRFVLQYQPHLIRVGESLAEVGGGLMMMCPLFSEETAANPMMMMMPMMTGRLRRCFSPMYCSMYKTLRLTSCMQDPMNCLIMNKMQELCRKMNGPPPTAKPKLQPRKPLLPLKMPLLRRMPNLPRLPMPMPVRLPTLPASNLMAPVLSPNRAMSGMPSAGGSFVPMAPSYDPMMSPPNPGMGMPPPAGGMLPPSGGMLPPSGGMLPNSGGMSSPSGMGPPPSGMGPPPSGMGPPPSGMGPPPSGMGPPPSGMGPPPSGMGPPPSGMGPPLSGMGPPPSGMNPPPNMGMSSNMMPSSSGGMGSNSMMSASNSGFGPSGVVDPTFSGGSGGTGGSSMLGPYAGAGGLGGSGSSGGFMGTTSSPLSLDPMYNPPLPQPIGYDMYSGGATGGSVNHSSAPSFDWSQLSQSSPLGSVNQSPPLTFNDWFGGSGGTVVETTTQGPIPVPHTLAPGEVPPTLPPLGTGVSQYQDPSLVSFPSLGQYPSVSLDPTSLSYNYGQPLNQPSSTFSQNFGVYDATNLQSPRFFPSVAANMQLLSSLGIFQNSNTLGMGSLSGSSAGGQSVVDSIPALAQDVATVPTTVFNVPTEAPTASSSDAVIDTTIESTTPSSSGPV